MTNSRLTDPEVLEFRFPVTLESFSVRKNSGGNGQYKGGDGIERQVLFNQDMSLSLLSGHRRIAPYALNQGQPGQVGLNILKKANGDEITLGSTDSVDIKSGDSIIIKTPGGGGYGVN